MLEGHLPHPSRVADSAARFKAIQPKAPGFATFWQGPASPYEAACLHSFVNLGYEITVFSYEPVPGLPKDVRVQHASILLGEDLRDRFMYKGKPDIRHFSDYFRFILSRETDLIWTDADIVLIREIDVKLASTVLTKEWGHSLCNSVLRIDQGDSRLQQIIERCEAMMGKSLIWGQTGPRLLTSLFAQELKAGACLGPERFYPIDFDDFWKVLLPEYFEECQTLTASAYGVHLWNNLIESLGLWKRFAPPVGSYLHHQIELGSAVRFFDGVYDLAPIRQLVNNWRLRKSGGDLGIKQIARQLVPSVARTFRHYYGS